MTKPWEPPEKRPSQDSLYPTADEHGAALAGSGERHDEPSQAFHPQPRFPLDARSGTQHQTQVFEAKDQTQKTIEMRAGARPQDWGNLTVLWPHSGSCGKVERVSAHRRRLAPSAPGSKSAGLWLGGWRGEPELSTSYSEDYCSAQPSSWRRTASTCRPSVSRIFTRSASSAAYATKSPSAASDSASEPPCGGLSHDGEVATASIACYRSSVLRTNKVSAFRTDELSGLQGAPDHKHTNAPAL